MTDWREELIEEMAKAIAARPQDSEDRWWIWEPEARAALAVAEPVIREQADNALREENARLREENDAWRMDGGSCAEEVKRLREENARLREALKPFAYIAEHVGEEDARWAVPSAHLRAAAAAIREGGKNDGTRN